MVQANMAQDEVECSDFFHISTPWSSIIYCRLYKKTELTDLKSLSTSCEVVVIKHLSEYFTRTRLQNGHLQQFGKTHVSAKTFKCKFSNCLSCGRKQNARAWSKIHMQNK